MEKEVEKADVILGVDPGTQVTGYGVISIQGHSYTPLDFGCIKPPARFKLSDRYLVIYNGITELVDKYCPDAVVVEMQFVYKNPQSALKLGMARGAVMIAARKKGVPVFEYAPTVAKRAVVGNGKASKHQVQRMVQQILKLSSPPTPEDAADALALAICHAHAAPHIRIKQEV